MEKILEIKNLNKKYFTKTALENVNLTLEKGRILGLMGPNGSGKTTLLKIIAGLQHVNSGSVQVCGYDIGLETKKLVSFLPDKNVLYPFMKSIDALNFFQNYYDDFDMKKALDMLDFMKLDKNEKVSAMSKGMIEKLNLTLAFSRNAKLFVLDEPLGGVDPVARDRIISTIIKTYNEDSSIIISTHLVNDVERIFDDVCFIGKGKVILSGSAEDLRVEKGLSIDQLYIETFQDE
ncbi:MAG: ABC transporter ATP-binding protein [Spirochaetaceae bacterium]|nr:ABC transporter ATP-binding protein [Spirochaetaceae bacterium]